MRKDKLNLKDMQKRILEENKKPNPDFQKELEKELEKETGAKYKGNDRELKDI